jgi:hypothetical protein
MVSSLQNKGPTQFLVSPLLRAARAPDQYQMVDPMPQWDTFLRRAFSGNKGEVMFSLLGGKGLALPW